MRVMALGFLVAGLLASGCGSTPVEDFDPRDANCSSAAITFDLGQIEATADTVPSSVIADGLVFVHRRATAFSNAASDLEVFALQVATGRETQVTANDVDDRLLDSREGAMLIHRSGGEAPELVYRDGSREVVLGPTTALGLGAEFESPRHLVRKDRAAWLSEGTVYYFDGISARSVSDGLRINSAPYLDGNLVVWTAYDGNDTEVYLYRHGITERLSDNDIADTSPVTSASTIFWLSGGAVVKRGLRDSRIETLAPGPCTALATHRGEAVFVCGRTEGDVIGLGGDRLFHYDGISVKEVATLGGYVVAPRIHDGRLAWIEYESPDALCSPGTLGQVVFWSGLAGAAPRQVDLIGSGCLCCGAYWPPPTLAFEGDVLSWNYAVPVEPRSDIPINLGYAVVRTQALCTPAE